MLGERRVKKNLFCACVIAIWRLAWDQVPQLEKKAKKTGERSEPNCSPPQCTARLASLADFFFLFVCCFTPFFYHIFPAVEPGHRTFSGRPQKKGSFLVINK